MSRNPTLAELASARRGPGLATDMRYRTVPEDRVLEMLLLAGWAHAAEEAPEVATEAAAEAAAATRRALRSWVEMGLGVRETADGGRCYDPVEVVNFLKRRGLDGEDDFWAQRYVATGRRLVNDLQASMPSPDQADGARRFAVDFSRTFSALAGDKPLRVRAPLPLPGEDLQDLEIAASLEGPGDLRVSPGRMEARIAPAGSGDVTLRAKLSFTASRHRPGLLDERLSPEAQALYLRPREGLVVVTDTVAALAAALAPPSAAPGRAVAAFWDYLVDELMSGVIHYDQVDVAAPCDWVLRTGCFDCQLGSALLIALCRARGLPARLASGHLLYRLAPTNHYWAEVFLGDAGWTPFDLLSWDLSLGGRNPAWRNHFFGALDARMTMQRLPLEFTGALGAPMPASWHMLQSAVPGGVAIDLVSLAGRSIYRDVVRVADPAG
jgi:hypothetical protein